MLEFHFNLVNLTIMAHKLLFLKFIHAYLVIFSFACNIVDFLGSCQNMPKSNKIVINSIREKSKMFFI